MAVREKLVDLLDDMQRSGTGYFGNAIENKKITDHLISNGVTVQEWIPVTKRLPKNGKEDVLIALRWGEVDIGGCEDGRWRSEFVNEYEDGEVTHWMPLPQPPKGE